MSPFGQYFIWPATYTVPVVNGRAQQVPPSRLSHAWERLPAGVKSVLRPAARAVRNRVPGAASSPSTPRPSLDQIGLAAGTDKASSEHDYLQAYEMHLGHLRDRKFKLVELGVHKGASIRLWEQYFTRSAIIGIDIDPNCQEFQSDRTRIVIADQGDQKFLARFAQRHHPLVVIDDGSHLWRHQIDTFRTLWPSVQPGGYFIVEDIHTSFGADHVAKYGAPGAVTAYEYLTGLAQGLAAGERANRAADDFESYCRMTIESVTVLQHALIVRKRPHEQPWYPLGSVAEIAAEPWLRDVGPTYERIDAEIVDANPTVARNFRHLVESGPAQFEPAASGLLTDVSVYAMGPAASGDRILAETLNCAWGLRRTSRLYRPFEDEQYWVVENVGTVVHKPVREDGKHYVLLKQTWDRNYGHWLIDAFPKVGLLAGHVELIDCVVVVNHQPSAGMRKVVTDALGMAGVDPGNIEFIGVNTHQFDELIVLGTLSRHPVRKAPFAIEFLEGIAAQVPAGGNERIYLSRNQYQRRRLVNENELLEVLSDHGYAVLNPEQLSFREQVAAFRGATHVIGNMGAAMASLAFSRPGVSVLALATETMNHDFFYDIVCLKRGRYRGIQGRAVLPDGTARPDNGSDFVVDVDRLRDGLAWLHG